MYINGNEFMIKSIVVLTCHVSVFDENGEHVVAWVVWGNVHSISENELDGGHEKTNECFQEYRKGKRNPSQNHTQGG